MVADLGLDQEELIALGRTHPENSDEEFGMTQAALRLSRSANGVSARHGGVARTMWTELWPGRAAEAIPIGHVTNGVHVRTWMGPEMRGLLSAAARRRLAVGDRCVGRASIRSTTVSCGRHAGVSAVG